MAPAIIVIGLLVLPGIIYFLVRGAVHDGVYDALIQYDKYKNKEQNGKDN
ncbi:MAG: hypothetical protein LIR50_08145 [Bacillota bacterium]|nr:hypothetical protein [Bacillota bacterium]